ncbi:MAG: DMT family transporter [Candidatus Sericytochromatia bacterium]|nr:DMT family transporter [Candidatus Sericytochromatia bacterium]
MAAASAIWGATFVASKVVLAVVPPFALVAGRFALAWLLLRLVMRWRGIAAVPWRQAWIPLLLGTVGMVISIGAQFIGTDLTSASQGALVTSAAPALMALFAAVILGERLLPLHVASIGIATAGVVLVTGIGGSGFHLLGHGALAVAATTWALYSVLTRWACRHYDPMVLLAGACGWGALLALPFARWDWPVVRLLEPAIGGSVVFIALGATVLAFLLWSWGCARLPARVGGLFMFVQPVVGTGLAAWLLGEMPAWTLYAGGALILAGVALAQRTDQA